MKHTQAAVGNGRLSAEKLQRLEKRALRFRQLVHWVATRKVQNHKFESLSEAMFAIAAELISRKTDKFCDAAEDEFDSIEAHGQEPVLDDDWLDELTGKKDNFYFSTDSIEKGLPPLPRRARTRQHEADLDEAQMVHVVEAAVQSFEDAMAVSHVEKPQEWIETIESALRLHGGEANFWWLQRSTRLSPAALFLGLLLGHQRWCTTQIDFLDLPEFYSSFSVQLIDNH